MMFIVSDANKKYTKFDYNYNKFVVEHLKSGDLRITEQEPVDYEKQEYVDDFNIEIYYGCQFVNGETHSDISLTNRNKYKLNHVPVMGTITGYTTWNDQTINTFVSNFNNHTQIIVRNENTENSPKLLEGIINYITGEIEFIWDYIIGDHTVSFSYEYVRN